MAQNIPIGLLQTAQQQYSQGTAPPITAPTDSTEDNTSMGLAKAMVGKGAMAQKLARERTAENRDRFQTMFADSGVGFQGLLNTLAIGLGDKIPVEMKSGEMIKHREVRKTCGALSIWSFAPYLFLKSIYSIADFSELNSLR